MAGRHLDLTRGVSPVTDETYVANVFCHSCHRLTSGLLCEVCRHQMRPGPERILPGGLRVVSAFDHSGPARKLVHHLKYRGLTGYADLVVGLLAERVPSLPLVPVPRVLSRRVRYGVDPALEIASRLSARTGLPVFELLGTRLHVARRAGGDHTLSGPAFFLRQPIKSPVVLVDDVVTTGATLTSAARSVGSQSVAGALTANAVAEVSSLFR